MRLLTLTLAALLFGCGTGEPDPTPDQSTGTATGTSSSSASSSGATSSTSSSSTGTGTGTGTGGLNLGVTTSSSSTSGTGNQGTSTPLCLSFDNTPVEFTQNDAPFALSDAPASTDWIDGATPWLVLDVNGNGKIDDGRELFGSMTRLPDSRVARDGFEALRPLDADGDGWLTPKDARFRELRLWSDRNQDRVAQPDELETLDSRGIEAIQLTNAISPHCDARGNCELERATFYFRDGAAWRHGTIVDVHLKNR